MSITLPTVSFSSVPRTAAPIQTPYGVLTAPGTRVAAYVRSTGVQDGDDSFIQSNLVATIADALSRCRAGLGDSIFVLPGHVESISSADHFSGLVAGTNIVGIGQGTNRPTLTWTAAASTVLLDVADVTLQNMILDFAGTAATTVAAPITVSAAGVSIVGCSVQTGVGAAQLCTIGITTTAAADDFSIIGCQFYGATVAGSTAIIRIVGGTRFRMHGCDIQAATALTTIGLLSMLTTAPTFMKVSDCTFANRKALSVAAVSGMAAASGVFANCLFGILDTATTAGLTTPALLMMSNCYTVNTAGENGAATTPVSA